MRALGRGMVTGGPNRPGRTIVALDTCQGSLLSGWCPAMGKRVAVHRHCSVIMQGRGERLSVDGLSSRLDEMAS
jgi:hypothetical protein